MQESFTSLHLYFFSFFSGTAEQNETEKPDDEEVKENESDESKSDEKSEENTSKTEEEAKDDDNDDDEDEDESKKEVENIKNKEETLKRMNELDGWTKSKKSRTPTPEPVSADPKSAEDEAMDTSDPPESKSELANNDEVKTSSNESNTNKNSLLPDLPKPVPTNVKADNEGKEEGAEKCSDTENTEQNANDKTKEEKLVEDAIAVKQ